MTRPSSVTIQRPAPGVGVVAMGEPGELNLWNPALEAQVFDALDTLASDGAIRVIGLSSLGRAFSAGGDLAGVAARLDSTESVAVEAEAILQRNVLRTLAIPKPVIAAVNGPCIGMGFVLALACDFRLLSDNARLSAGFVKRGFIAEHCTSWLLPRIVGVGDALDILLTGRVIEPDEALAMRLVHRVCPASELTAALVSFASSLADATSPRSQAVIKRQVYNDLQLSLAESARRTVTDMVVAFRSADAREGIHSFLDKRETRFPDYVADDGLPPIQLT